MGFETNYLLPGSLVIQSIARIEVPPGQWGVFHVALGYSTTEMNNREASKFYHAGRLDVTSKAIQQTPGCSQHVI